MKVIAFGRVAVFPRDGQYQLYCAELTPDGVGDLHVAFEQLQGEAATGRGCLTRPTKSPCPDIPSASPW